MRSRSRRLKALGASALLMVTAGVGMTAAAAPSASAAADPNCTGYGTNALVDSVGPDYSAAYIQNRTTGKAVGVVQLCHRKTSDGTWVRWAAVTLYYDMSAGQKANGRIYTRSTAGGEGEAWCSDPGGTGPIIGGTGDRTCATPGLEPFPGWSERGEGAVYGTNGALIAYGATNMYPY